MAKVDKDQDGPHTPFASEGRLERFADWARRRGRLVRFSLNSAFQVALSAGVAWWLATVLLPWDEPVYAPIGAVVAIGTGENRLLDRPLRLLGGMLVAVAVAGIVVGWLGSGAGQIVLITLVTTVIGRFLFDDTLARTYSAFHGAVIGALGSSQVIPEQLTEAAIGAVTGIVIVHIVFPPRIESTVLTPVERAGSSARRSLRALAAALRTGDHQEVRRAVDAAVEVEAYLAPEDQRRRFGRQLVRFSPVRRQDGAKAERVIQTDRRLSSLLLEVADLARLSQRLTMRERETHPELSVAVEDFDVALGWLLRHTFDPELREKIAESVDRLEARLDYMVEMTRPQQMVCENLRQLNEELADAAERMPDRGEGT